MEIATDYSVNSKLLSTSLAVKESTRLFGSANRALQTSSVAGEISRD